MGCYLGYKPEKMGRIPCGQVKSLPNTGPYCIPPPSRILTSHQHLQNLLERHVRISLPICSSFTSIVSLLSEVFLPLLLGWKAKKEASLLR